jgi:hypothetical protein
MDSELLQALFAAAIELSGLPATDTRPPVEPLPYVELLDVVCADLESPKLAGAAGDAAEWRLPPTLGGEAAETPPHQACMAQKGLVAAYLPGQFRIVYRDTLDLSDDDDNSFIVHEFVHALQEQQRGRQALETCMGALAAEQEAYAVQQKYLQSRGQLLRVGERLRFVTCDTIM